MDAAHAERSGPLGRQYQKCAKLFDVQRTNPPSRSKKKRKEKKNGDVRTIYTKRPEGKGEGKKPPPAHIEEKRRGTFVSPDMYVSAFRTEFVR